MKRRDFLRGVIATIVGVPLMKLAPYLPKPVVNTMAKFNWKTYSASITLKPTNKKDARLANLLTNMVRHQEESIINELDRAFFLDRTFFS